MFVADFLSFFFQRLHQQSGATCQFRWLGREHLKKDERRVSGVDLGEGPGETRES